MVTAATAVSRSVTERPRCELETNKKGQGKVIFATLEDAEAFENNSRQTHGFDKQYAYPCPHGDHFHLTSTPQDVRPFFAKSNFADIAKFKQVHCVNSKELNMGVSSGVSRRHFSLEQKAEIVLKVVEGSTRASVCTQYDIEPSLLSYWMNKTPYVMSRVKEMVEKKKRHGTATVADCESEEQKLEHQLAEIRSKKQALIEAKKPRLKWQSDDILVTKEGGTLVFSRDEFQRFIEQATDFLTIPTAAAAVP